MARVGREAVAHRVAQIALSNLALDELDARLSGRGGAVEAIGDPVILAVEDGEHGLPGDPLGIDDALALLIPGHALDVVCHDLRIDEHARLRAGVELERGELDERYIWRRLASRIERLALAGDALRLALQVSELAIYPLARGFERLRLPGDKARGESSLGVALPAHG